MHVQPLELPWKRSSGFIPAAAIGGACVGLSLIAALSVSQGQRSLLVLLLTAAGAVIIFSLQPQFVFLTWLLIAPLLQNSADSTTLGHPLVMALYIAPALALLVWTLSTPRTRGAGPSFVDVLPGAYVLYVVLSLALTTTDLHDAPVSSLKGVFTAVGIGAVAYYFAAFGPTVSTALVVKILLRSGILVSVMGIADGLVGWNLWNDTGWHHDLRRSVATLSNPAVYGAFVGMCLALALGVLVWNGPKQLRREAWTMLVVGLPAVFWSLTRGPIIAAVVAGTLIAVLHPKTRLLATGIFVVAAVLIVASWGHIASTSAYQQRVVESRNVEARILIQDWSVKLAEQRPVFGWGYNSFDRVKNSAQLSAGELPAAFGTQNTSHNTWLTVLVEYGGIGFLLLVIPWLVVGWRTAKEAVARPETRWFLTGVLGALLVYVITASTIDMRFFSFVTAVPWLLLGLVRRQQRLKEHEYA